MAINENGTSEPLRSSAPVTAQLPFSMSKRILNQDLLFLFLIEPPGSPGQPEITELTNNSATLNWDKPSSDGGNKFKKIFI
jgi:hypothetical protein